MKNEYKSKENIKIIKKIRWKSHHTKNIVKSLPEYNKQVFKKFDEKLLKRGE